MLILVKWGGSLITNKEKPYSARRQVIKRLALEIHAARAKNDFKLILGHGGGSYPHQSAFYYKIHEGIKSEESLLGISRVHKDADELNKLVINALQSVGECPLPIPPSSSCTAENRKILRWDLKPIKNMLKTGLLPVTYGDVVLDLKQGCAILSTETILSYFAKQLKAQKLILCGNVLGVYDSEGRVIKEITPKNYKEIKKHLTATKGKDVTGGMLHKVNSALALVKSTNIKVEIIDGSKPGVVRRALEGKEGQGTIIKRV